MSKNFKIEPPAWVPQDIMDICEVTEEEAIEFMDRNGKLFNDRITELGWEVWKAYAEVDGLPEKLDEEEED